jgi:hypothetical protein
MNWIEIDKILYGIIARHDTVEGMFDEAKKQFRWNQSQAEAAVKPLLKRNTFSVDFEDTAKKVEFSKKGAINKE